MYLVLEYMKRGDLINFINMREDQENKDNKRKSSKAFVPLTDTELWVIFKEVVAGVRYLHLQNIVHGDIKPQVLFVYQRYARFSNNYGTEYTGWGRWNC